MHKLLVAVALLGCGKREREEPASTYVTYEQAKAGCEAKDQRMCGELAQYLATGRDRVETNLAKAEELARPGCEANEPESCRALGAVYEAGFGGPPDEAKAVGYYEKACNAGAGGACLEIADIYTSGRTWKSVNGVIAVKFLEKACTLKEEIACMRLEDFEKGK